MANFSKDWWKIRYRSKPYQTHVATLGHIEGAMENIEITSDDVSFEDTLGVISPLTEVLQDLLDGGGGADLSNYYNKQEVDSKVITTTERNKLAGIATNATANDTDANLKNRANHTGTQPFSTISGTASISQIPTGTTSATVALGNHTHTNADTTNAGFMSSSDKLKLDGITTNATANDTDANLKNRANHTGTQAFTTLSGTATVAQVPNLPSSKINLMTGYVNTVTGAVTPADTLNQAISKIENRFKVGQITFGLGGAETVFTIPHGYSVVPSSFALTFSDGANLDFIQSVRTIDATNITITCGTAPTGADITVYWQAFL